ncbi:MAG: hypothetical protein A3G21_23720 [Acidobacteria bacterium RIFCSPLOWO2_12_FULL_66_21]|nr:MAG: hypothetical protein A3G21_23720 [Acidobacteria bacterium RIFCSPLOWO2_12_FULL_66_21]
MPQVIDCSEGEHQPAVDEQRTQVRGRAAREQPRREGARDGEPAEQRDGAPVPAVVDGSGQESGAGGQCAHHGRQYDGGCKSGPKDRSEMEVHVFHGSLPD